MPELVSISALRRGQLAEVFSVVGAPAQVRRLEELGLRRGAELEVVCGGSPCIVRIEGTKLCFRDDELASVLVKPRKTA